MSIIHEEESITGNLVSHKQGNFNMGDCIIEPKLKRGLYFVSICLGYAESKYEFPSQEEIDEALLKLGYVKKDLEDTGE